MNMAAANVPTAMYALCNPTVVPFETIALKLGSPKGRACAIAASSVGISLLLTTVSTMNSSGRMKITRNKIENIQIKNRKKIVVSQVENKRRWRWLDDVELKSRIHKFIKNNAAKSLKTNCVIRCWKYSIDVAAAYLPFIVFRLPLQFNNSPEEDVFWLCWLAVPRVARPTRSHHSSRDFIPNEETHLITHLRTFFQ